MTFMSRRTPSTVNLILGPARSGKTAKALARYSAALDSWRKAPAGPQHIWIGPTPSALNDVRDRLADLARGAWLNPRTATFATLAQEIIAQGDIQVRPISPLEKLRILAHVVENLLDSRQLKHFAGVATTPGFLRQVGAAIADLKRRDVWADEFGEQSRTPRDQDFSAIYSAYQEHLLRYQLYDAEGRFWAAREVLEASPASLSPPASLPRKWGELRYGLVVLDGFADFTLAQHDLLRILADHCQELLITLPADAGAEPRTLLFDKPRRTLEQLEKSFPHLQRETASESRFLSAGLAVVERNMFRDDPIVPPPLYPGEGLGEGNLGLSIIAASSVQGEIREIVRRVKQLLLTGGARPHEIAVVFPSVDDVAVRVREVFDDFDLPLALESRRRLSELPFTRTLFKLLRLVAEDWPFELLLDIVGDQNLFISPSENDSQAAIESCIRRGQLPAGRKLLLDQIRVWADTDTEDKEPDARSIRAATALAGLDAVLSPLAEHAVLSTWITRLEMAVGSLGLITPMNSTHWQLLQSQLELIVQTDQQFDADDRALDAAEVLSLLTTIANQTFVKESTDDIGRIRIMSAESARNLSVKHLFLGGLSEQSYSSAEGTGSLYREAEMQRFTDGNIAANITQQQTGEALLLFYDMATRASENLTLSYAALDDKGQALTPSPYLTELERCFAVGTIPLTVMSTSGASQRDTPMSRSDWRTTGMSTALDGHLDWLAGLVGEPACKSVGRAILHGAESVASRSNRDAFGPFEGLLLSESAHARIARRFGGEHLWSPSQLETYATCPYQFFAAQILRLEPLADIALRSDHLRKGHLLHQVLAAIHAQGLEPGTTINDQLLIERFSSALTKMIRDTPLHGLEDALREIERREIHSWAASYAQQELDYRNRWQDFEQPLAPVHFEVRFGPKARGGSSANDAVSVEVPFTLDLGTEQIKLTGQIDRVDMGRIAGVTVFTIIDYKSGKEVRLSNTEIAAGRQLQLPLYALAAEKLLFAEQQAVALGAGYWSVKEKGFAAGGGGMLEIRSASVAGLAEATEWESLQTGLASRIAEIVRGVRAAHFPVYNEKKDCTQYCDFSKICRIAQVRSLEKVWISPTSELK